MFDSYNRKIEKVLLVDDDANLRLIVQVSIEKLTGWTVTATASAQEALAYLEDEKPDLILLDVMMPEIDGPMLFQMVRDRFDNSIPVIFLTAKVQNHEIHRFKSLGAHGLIIKPFDPLTLVAQIKRILGIQSL